VIVLYLCPSFLGANYNISLLCRYHLPHVVIVLYIFAPLLGVICDRSLVLASLFGEPLITKLYIVNFIRLALGGNYIITYMPRFWALVE
jgi:hypothetical protein